MIPRTNDLTSPACVNDTPNEAGGFRAGARRGAAKGPGAPHPFPINLPGASLHLLFPGRILYDEPVNSISLSSVGPSRELWNPRRGPWEPHSIADGSEARLTAGTCDWV